jgi:hypothetical protein
MPPAEPDEPPPARSSVVAPTPQDGHEQPGKSDTPVPDPVIEEPSVRLGSNRVSFLISTRVAEIRPQVLHLYNDTDQPVRITRIRIVDDPSSVFGAGSAVVFGVDRTELPFDVAAGESVELTVRFAPIDDIMKRAVLIISTTDADVPELRAGLLGKVYVDPQDTAGY